MAALHVLNAWTRLDAWFGDKNLFIKDLMQDIKSVSPIKDGDDERLMDYYVTLQAHIEEAHGAGALGMLLIPANVELMVQRIATKAKKSCLTLWDTGSQVSLTTHEAARGMRLEPIPGPPLNLKGVGDSQRTRSTVRYKIPLFDTGGRMKEVTAYGIDHIMAPIEAVDPKPMRAVFPEVPTGGLEAVSGRVDLLIGHDNFRLFPVEHKRVQNAMLARSHFGTGWIASGRPLGQGDPATSTGEAWRRYEQRKRSECLRGEGLKGVV